MDQTQLQSPDVYGRTFQMDAQILDVMATRLEARGRHPFFLRAISEYLTEVPLAEARGVLDLGCGTGAAARAIARRPELHGMVTAIDISAHLVETGRRLSEEEGWLQSSLGAEWRGESTPFASLLAIGMWLGRVKHSGAFSDAAQVAQALGALPDPQDAARELQARVSACRAVLRAPVAPAGRGQ